MPDTIKTAVMTGAAAAALGLPFELGAAAGAAGSVLRFDFRAVRRVAGLPNELKPYAYLVSMANTLRP
jgi:hypothetical protein